MEILDQTITDSMLLKAVQTYIDITGKGRLAFIREIQSLAEQVAQDRFDAILDSSGQLG